MTMRHVFLIIDSLELAGTQLQTRRLAQGLAEHGLRVTVALLEHPSGDPVPEIPGVEVISTPVASLRSPWALRDLLRLTRTIRERRPDAVHINNVHKLFKESFNLFKW